MLLLPIAMPKFPLAAQYHTQRRFLHCESRGGKTALGYESFH